MISIVIPCYQHGRALPACLKSIEDQTDTDWEVILVDDGSTDGTEDIIQRYKASSSRGQQITYLRQENTGAPAARNAGTRRAKGEYLLFADADLLLRPEMLEELRKAIEAHPEASYAYSDFRFGWKLFRGKPFAPDALRQQNYIHTSALIRSRDFIGFDESLRRFQDWDLWLRLLDAGKIGVWVPQVLFRARVTRAGISRWRPRAWYALFRRFPWLAPSAYLDYITAKQTLQAKRTKTVAVKVDVSVCIVTWNAASDIRDCLASLARAAKVNAIEVVVVDNGSTDGTREIVRASFPEVRLIENPMNLGFSRACNIAAAATSGESLLFLNPDARVYDTTFSGLQAVLNTQPNCGIVGPLILEEDGSRQPSCRQFPSLFVCFALALKITHLVRQLKPFRAYEMSGFQGNTLRAVDQVMGAAFFVRRSTFRELGGFDQRYFIWFEEVDFCFRARQKGWITMFTPQANVSHRRSTSFAKRSFLWRHWYFTQSLVRFTRAHSGRLAASMLAVARLLPVPIVCGADMLSAWSRSLSSFSSWSHFASRLVMVLVAVDAMSFLAHFMSSIEPLFFVSIIVIFTYALVRYPLIAAVLIITELVIGSHGHELGIVLLGQALSLRMGLFAVALAWAAAFMWRNDQLHLKRSPEVRALLVLSGLVVCGVAIGLKEGNSVSLIFSDANGYVALLLFLPLLILAPKRQDVRVLLIAASCGAFYVGMKTLGLTYVFSHDFPFAQIDVYQWLRDSRIAELTPTTTGAYRIFLPAQAWVLLLWFAALRWVTRGEQTRLATGFGVLASATLLVSFSRSYWLGWALATLIFGLWLGVRERGFRNVFRVGVRSVTYILLGFLLIVGLLRIPFPRAVSSGALALDERFALATESAASSRWNQLKPLSDRISSAPLLGSGFGTTVTYVSNDPRVRAQSPSGELTTSIVEWGYLDMLTEVGLLGVVLYLMTYAWVIFSLLKKGDGTNGGQILAFFLLSVCLVHLGSPYLNHPIGSGILVLCLLWLSASRTPLTEQGKHAIVEPRSSASR